MDSQVFRSALDETLQGRYVVERELGTGGMSLVYEAWDPKHERRVAIKVLRREVAVVSGTERFLREIRLTANLQHPHILPLLDSGAITVHGMEVPYYVMPLVTGQSLRLKLDLEGRLSLAETMPIVRDVAQALAFAHEHGIVHRDIKPENVLLGAAGSAIVADFGLARARGSERDTSLTQTGASVGTPLYMSPEQAFGEGEIDHRSDQYSLATVLFEMLTGEAPYFAATKEAILARRLVEPVPSIRSVLPGASPALDGALQRALARRPADRFPDIGPFLAAIELGLAPGTVTVARRPRGRSRAWRVGLGLTAILGTVVAVAISRKRPVPPPAERRSGSAPASPSDLITMTPVVSAGATATDSALVAALDLAITHAAGPRTVSPADIRATLHRMRRTDTMPPTVPVALEVAVRAGARMVLVPNLALLRDGRRLGYQVLAAASGKILRARDVAVGATESATAAVDRLTDSLGADLDAARPLAPAEALSRVTTSSLEALRFYSAASGPTYSAGSDFGQQVNQAIVRDSDFAAAHAEAAYTAWFDYDQRAAEEHAAQALRSLERIGQVGEDERLQILMRVANAREDWQAAIDAAQSSVDRDPIAGGSWSILGQMLFFDRQFVRAVQAYDSALIYDKGALRAVTLINQASVLERVGRLEQAVANYRAAAAVDSTVLRAPFSAHEYAATLARLGKAEDARRLVALRFVGKPEEKGYALRSAALIDANEGHYRKAEESLAESVSASAAADDTVGIAWSRVLLADLQRTRGDRRAALETLAPLETIARSRPVPYEIVTRAVKVLARLGAIGRAASLDAVLVSRTRVRSGAARSRLAMAEGEVALARGQASAAKPLFERAIALEPTDDNIESLAEAELALRDYPRAATRFEGLGRKRGVDFDGFYSIEDGMFRAAVAWDRGGQVDRARAAYQAFLQQWPSADEDLPAIVLAKGALRKLDSPTR